MALFTTKQEKLHLSKDDDRKKVLDYFVNACCLVVKVHTPAHSLHLSIMSTERYLDGATYSVKGKPSPEVPVSMACVELIRTNSGHGSVVSSHNLTRPYGQGVVEAGAIRLRDGYFLEVFGLASPEAREAFAVAIAKHFGLINTTTINAIKKRSGNKLIGNFHECFVG